MKNKKIMVLVIIFAIVIISIFSFNLLKSNKYSNDTIGSLAYNYTKNEEIVYLLEDGKYIPYIVLHNNYSNNSDTLLLRKNVIGNDEYYTGYNGSIMTEKIYKSHLEMSNFENYENTAVDNFLVAASTFDLDIVISFITLFALSYADLTSLFANNLFLFDALFTFAISFVSPT